MKRTVDIVVALVALLVLLPVMILVTLLVRADMGSPVLFRQTRPGLHGRPFQLVKFRTMRDCTGPDGRPCPDDQRLTRLGRALRAASLDELPQLWNVLRGHMSLVGPRPLLPEYLSRYRPEHRRRHEVRPGMTGLAQVNGRNALSWEDRFDLDVWYVDHRNAWVDAKVLLRTVGKVVTRDGVLADNHVTVEPFRGTG